LDNDIILKLVDCNLFSEALRSLNLVESNLRVLSDAKYVFRNSRQIAKKYPLEIRESAILIVERWQNIQPQLSEELRNLQIEGLDAILDKVLLVHIGQIPNKMDKSQVR
jgi:transcription termination factor NusB